MASNSSSILSTELSHEVRVQLQDFFQHPGWRLMEGALSELLQVDLNNLTTEEDHSKVRYLQGRIAGLNKVVGLRDDLLRRTPTVRR